MNNEGRAVDIAYMDFAKAFDEVPYGRLVQKIKSYGIHNGHQMGYVTESGLFCQVKTLVIKVKTTIGYNVHRAFFIQNGITDYETSLSIDANYHILCHLSSAETADSDAKFSAFQLIAIPVWCGNFPAWCGNLPAWRSGLPAWCVTGQGVEPGFDADWKLEAMLSGPRLSQEGKHSLSIYPIKPLKNP
eukprot:g44353.t1